jgi:hypothetical protein
MGRSPARNRANPGSRDRRYDRRSQSRDRKRSRDRRNDRSGRSTGASYSTKPSFNSKYSNSQRSSRRSRSSQRSDNRRSPDNRNKNYQKGTKTFNLLATDHVFHVHELNDFFQTDFSVKSSIAFPNDILPNHFPQKCNRNILGGQRSNRGKSKTPKRMMDFKRITNHYLPFSRRFLSDSQKI